MMAVFAFACALLVAPVAEPAIELRDRRQNIRERPAQSYPRHAPVQVVSPPIPAGGTAARTAIAPTKSGELWGKDIEWPEAWRKPTKPQPSPATNSEKPIGSRGQ
jgi:hypothetical protein